MNEWHMTCAKSAITVFRIKNYLFIIVNLTAFCAAATVRYGNIGVSR